MRLYDVVSKILLILSTIDLTLAVPILVQEKSQAYVDVYHIPKDVTAVLGKRGSGDLENVMLDYFKTLEKPEGSSGTPTLSGSAPLQPVHGSTNVEPVPGPNQESLTANPDHEIQELHEPEIQELYEPEIQEEQPKPGPSEEPFDWEYWKNYPDPPLPKPVSSKPKLMTKIGRKLKYWANRWMDVMDPLKPPPSSKPSNSLKPKPWSKSRLKALFKPASLKPSNPKPSDLGPSNAGPSNVGPSYSGDDWATIEAIQNRATGYRAVTGTNPSVDRSRTSVAERGLSGARSSSCHLCIERQAKQLRRNSGTARDDVAEGNAVQSELQPEISHDKFP